MATTYYRITAYSNTCMERVQEVDLTEDPSQNHAYAQERARTYAERLNKQKYLHCTDWVGTAEPNVVNHH